MVQIEKTAGSPFFDHVKDILELNGIDIKNCIDSSTDGVSNVRVNTMVFIRKVDMFTFGTINTCMFKRG